MRGINAVKNTTINPRKDIDCSANRTSDLLLSTPRSRGTTLFVCLFGVNKLFSLLFKIAYVIKIPRSEHLSTISSSF